MLEQAQRAAFFNTAPDSRGTSALEEHDAVKPPPSRSEVMQSLDRILSAGEFARSARLKAFLSYVVTTSLAGEADRIKGYTVAVEALGHSADHDPQTDPAVRVLACRLRQALALYYSGSGGHDAIRIDIPKGGYAPEFSRLTHAAMPDTVDRAMRVHQSDPETIDLLGSRRTVFDQISTMAAHLTQAASAIVATCDHTAIHVLGHHGMAAPTYRPEFGFCNLLDTTMPVIEIDDVGSDPRLREHPIQDVRPAVRRLIFVPMQSTAAGRGAVVLVDPSPDFTLSTRHGTLLCDLADLATQEVKTMLLLKPAGAQAVPHAA